MTGPLDGIKVFDLTVAGVGPWAAMLLGSLGARVIKIEGPQGDYIHGMPPYQGGLSTTYAHCNLNKLGAVMDLKKEEVRARAHELVKDADVFMENMRPGSAAALGFDRETVSKLNPTIVYGSFPGWGHEGPLKDRPAVDPHIQAFSGAVSISGRPGKPGEFLRYYAFHDLNASCYVIGALLLGLHARARTGQGQYVAAAQVGASVAMQITHLAGYLADGSQDLPLVAPQEMFRCENGKYLAVGVETDDQWLRLCDAIGLDDLGGDERYATIAGRVAHREGLAARLRDVFETKPTRWWTTLLRKHGVPCGPLHDFEDILNDPDVIRNGHVGYVTMPGRGEMAIGNVPWRFSSFENRMQPGPDPGAHSEAVLRHGFAAAKSPSGK